MTHRIARSCHGVSAKDRLRHDGTYAQRSTVASRSSPAAAQRGAEGAGLDGDDRGRSPERSQDPSQPPVLAASTAAMVAAKTRNGRRAP